MLTQQRSTNACTRAGNPVSETDPTGRSLVEDAYYRVKFFVTTTFIVTKLGASVVCYINFLADVANSIAIGARYLTPVAGGIADSYLELRVCLEFASIIF